MNSRAFQRIVLSAISAFLILPGAVFPAAKEGSVSPAPHAAKYVSWHGITWTFSNDRTVGQFVNGEPWVVGPVTITNIDPNPSKSVDGVQHGSMINPIPNKNFGFDDHPKVTREIIYEATKNVALSFPFTLKPGDVLVSAISQNIYPTYLKTVGALTVLEGPPKAGSFRPGIFGNDRTVKWNANQLNWSVLKNYPAVPSTPSKVEIAAYLPPLPWFEWANIWSGNGLQPKDNTADGDKQYGREIAAKFGHVGLWLNTNQPLADKRPVAIQMVQNGLDIYNYVKQGGGFTADGGHKCGRKLPLVVAAMMLNDPELKAMAGNPNIFQEDQQIWFVSQSDVGRVLWVPKPGDSWYGREFSQYRQEDVGMAEWGIRHSWLPFEDNRSWSATYRAVVGPGMMGPWLAAYLMDAQPVWNHPAALAYMERYHALSGDGGTNPSQVNFNKEMYAAYKKSLTPNSGKGGATAVTPPAPAAVKAAPRDGAPTR